MYGDPAGTRKVLFEWGGDGADSHYCSPLVLTGQCKTNVSILTQLHKVFSLV